MDNLIVFAKKPILGNVKSRLAKFIGEQRALETYQQLLKITCKEVIAWQKEIPKFRQIHWYWDSRESESYSMEYFNEWTEGLQVSYQSSVSDLGRRMSLAFQEIISNANLKKVNPNFTLHSKHSESKTIIIGTDCPDINGNGLSQGFDLLEKSDIVLGPALDGGYYLLGMKDFYPELFEGIEWSTSQVLQSTVHKAKNLGLDVGLLTELRDLDDWEDYQYYLNRKIIF